MLSQKEKHRLQHDHDLRHHDEEAYKIERELVRERARLRTDIAIYRMQRTLKMMSLLL